MRFFFESNLSLLTAAKSANLIVFISKKYILRLIGTV